jgi:hypothetical protein
MYEQVACKQAFGKVLSAVKPGVTFPRNVFWEPWGNFLFFHDDALFFGNFTKTVRELLAVEGATAVCLVNLSRRSGAFDAGTSICLENKTTDEEYQNALRARNEGNGWLLRMDTYACASDIGKWCIYCEKGDIAVIALHSIDFMKQVPTALEGLRAYPLTSFWENQRSGAISRIATAWRKKLSEEYTPSLGTV